MDINSEPPWEVRDVPGRGKAAFSRQSYGSGDLIWAESPLVWVPFHWPFNENQAITVNKAVEALPTDLQEKFFTAANVHEDAPSRASGVFYTNSFDMTDAYHGQSCAIYHGIARLNHSCVPNTRQEFDKDTLKMKLYATAPIAAGDQLFDSYVDLEMNVHERRRELAEVFRFHCDCARCEEEVLSSASNSV